METVAHQRRPGTGEIAAVLSPPAPALDLAPATYGLVDGPARESVARLLARRLELG